MPLLSRVSRLVLIAVWFLIAGNGYAQQPLRWGADPSGGAPYVYNDPSHPDQYIGYEKEMFDALVNGLEPTADRQKQIQFSKPYYIFQLALTVRNDEQQIHSLADCKNRVVGTLGNTAASRLLQQQGIPFKNYAEPPTAYRDLELKRIDAVIMDVPAEVFYV